MTSSNGLGRHSFQGRDTHAVILAYSGPSDAPYSADSFGATPAASSPALTEGMESVMHGQTAAKADTVTGNHQRIAFVSYET
jgi:hypothetical protein